MNNVYQEGKDFAKSYILPYTELTDKESKFPEETFKALDKKGFLKLLVPEEYGGFGKGLEEHAQACLAFSETCSTTALCYMMHNVAVMCILTHGSDELKRKIFTDIVENGKFMALAYSEIGSGVHFYKPEISTEVIGDNTTFNGKKSMVTSGTYASYYLVLAPAVAEGTLNNWVFPLETEGLSFEPSNWQGLGMRGNSSCPMKIENVTLDSTYRIGAEGSGGDQVFNVVAPFFITGLAAVYSGTSMHMFEISSNHAMDRKYPDGSSLAHIETIQIHIGDIYKNAAAAKAMTLEAARAGASGEADALAKILAARVVASEAAIECGRLAMRVGGGKAYNKGLPTERLLRDAYAGQVMAPSADILTVWLGKVLTDQMIP
ncbi:acyl-CoA dehydrogenase family protein [Bacillus benzoevorans]|uniref:Alkylation response protein AidB-like acyl-CoA dehydrogenase n=1 Tax=Bacillus benzoevorans TaxID=1456 RepID=A0A7X0HPI9_9BACI|nr:acyl-CoA dehydrogenase family protein [Bacillus benzoevorans]MBB6444468.1 alkylation response protein AidB-like acyl-CoA dehydrogenase [Bacillus benzoevorans]